MGSKTVWILKWLATVVLIGGTVINSLGFYPLGPLVLEVGSLLWLTVSILWKEPALIATNAIMTLAGASGLIYRLT